jgi:hypothetical protein
VNDTDNDRHLHLERVGKDESIVGSIPVWINTEGVDMTIVDGRDRPLSVLGPIETVRPDVERFGKDIIVDETGEDRERTHQQNEVSTTVQISWIPHDLEGRSLQEEGLDVLIDTGSGNLLFKDNHGESSEEHDDSMTDITKHDGKEEGEGNNGK